MSNFEHSGDQAVQDELYKVRHSLAHVMAQAVLEMRPGSTLGFGPPIQDGFYYDFILTEPLTFNIPEQRMDQPPPEHGEHKTRARGAVIVAYSYCYPLRIITNGIESDKHESHVRSTLEIRFMEYYDYRHIYVYGILADIYHYRVYIIKLFY